jgi:hypothetical protein
MKKVLKPAKGEQDGAGQTDSAAEAVRYKVRCSGVNKIVERSDPTHVVHIARRLGKARDLS